MARFGFIPNRLHAELAFVERAVDAQFDRERLGLQLNRSGQLARAFGQNMKQSLLQAAPFVALPFLVVVIAEIDDVFARNVGWTTGRREHLALHTGFDFARDLYQKLFPDAARLCVLVRLFKYVGGGFTVDPTSD